MGENTKIQWAKHTFNAWEGCTRVGPGCDHCYAEDRDKRFHGGIHWGAGAPRRRTSEKNWLNPLKWDREAAAAGERHRVFCNSLADVFDNEVDPAWRADLFALIRATPNLDWLLLTKRVGNIAKMLPADWGGGYPNVWLIATVVNQEEADRDIPKLLRIPARLRGLSVEPMLGRVLLWREWVEAGLAWIIIGGESGPIARPFHVDYARDLMADCKARDVPVFVKQLGAVQVYATAECRDLKDRKGGNPEEWPIDLRVREFPKP